MLEHDTALVRWTLAGRPDLPGEIHERLAADPAPGVRADLAANPVVVSASVPLDVLTHLQARSGSGRTRCLVS